MKIEKTTVDSFIIYNDEGRKIDEMSVLIASELVKGKWISRNPARRKYCKKIIEFLKEKFPEDFI